MPKMSNLALQRQLRSATIGCSSDHRAATSFPNRLPMARRRSACGGSRPGSTAATCAVAIPSVLASFDPIDEASALIRSAPMDALDLTPVAQDGRLIQGAASSHVIRQPFDVVGGVDGLQAACLFAYSHGERRSSHEADPCFERCLVSGGLFVVADASSGQRFAHGVRQGADGTCPGAVAGPGVACGGNLA